MKHNSSFYLGFAWLVAVVLSMNSAAGAQTLSSEPAVPRTVNYSGVAMDSNGKAAPGTLGATFAMYAEQSGGAPLWIETQNINVGANGKFAVGPRLSRLRLCRSACGRGAG